MRHQDVHLLFTAVVNENQIELNKFYKQMFKLTSPYVYVAREAMKTKDVSENGTKFSSYFKRSGFTSYL